MVEIALDTPQNFANLPVIVDCLESVQTAHSRYGLSSFDVSSLFCEILGYGVRVVFGYEGVASRLSQLTDYIIQLLLLIG